MGGYGVIGGSKVMGLWGYGAGDPQVPTWRGSRSGFEGPSECLLETPAGAGGERLLRVVLGEAGIKNP